MNRRAFVAVAGSSVIGFPSAARATGGLDIAGPSAPHAIRVLLESNAVDSPSPIDGWHFAWGGRAYRGTFAFVTLPDGRTGLVNTLPVDAYLAGVLGKEISPSWAPEAQRAQAIASRTYVLGKMRPEKPYDVLASESDQRYAGVENESVPGREAVDATSGVIVTYLGSPAHVAYSACCGGRTADAGDVWNTPYPYLQSVEDPYCPGSPGFAWDARIPTDRVEGALGEKLASVGALHDVHVLAANPAERPQAIVFAGAHETFETTPAIFRASVGPSIVPSTFVRDAALAEDGKTLALAGTGRGHGVGLCQWGMRAFGERGGTAAQILAFYFPGTMLGRA